jgi:hypothetical protein
MAHDDDPDDQCTANTEVLDPNRDTEIVRADSGGRIKRWRIGLHRLDRFDKHAPLIPFQVASGTPEPTLVSDSYSFASGFEHAPQWFPLRSNPVAMSFDVSVQINWGFGAAQPAHIAAQWPRMGGSVTIVGSNVEVFAHWRSNAPPDPNARPVATAWVAPADGQLTTDGGELSLTHTFFMVATGANNTRLGVIYVPDFARRVRIQLTLLDPVNASQQVAPFTGDINTISSWVDDQGNVTDSWRQGLFTSNAAVEHNDTITWHPVPAAATLLAIMAPAASANFGYAHWRIAP